jgi:hypothetical protein
VQVGIGVVGAGGHAVQVRAGVVGSGAGTGGGRRWFSLCLVTLGNSLSMGWRKQTGSRHKESSNDRQEFHS